MNSIVRLLILVILFTISVNADQGYMKYDPLKSQNISNASCIETNSDRTKVYVGADNNLTIYNVVNNSSLDENSSKDLNGSKIIDIAVDDNNVSFTILENNKIVVDENVSNLNLSVSAVSKIISDDNYLYIAARDDGVLIIDKSDTSNLKKSQLSLQQMQKG